MCLGSRVLPRDAQGKLPCGCARVKQGCVVRLTWTSRVLCCRAGSVYSVGKERVLRPPTDPFGARESLRGITRHGGRRSLPLEPRADGRRYSVTDPCATEFRW